MFRLTLSKSSLYKEENYCSDINFIHDWTSAFGENRVNTSSKRRWRVKRKVTLQFPLKIEQKRLLDVSTDPLNHPCVSTRPSNISFWCLLCFCFERSFFICWQRYNKAALAQTKTNNFAILLLKIFSARGELLIYYFSII